MSSVEGGHDGIRIMNELMVRFAAASLGNGTQSAMERRGIRPAKSAMGLADGFPARSGLRNDYCANQREYQ